MRRLVLGGARSGKSTWAEQQFAELNSVEYVATSALGDDPEWRHRVDLHRARRPSTWHTTETIDLAEVLTRDDPRPVLIDCLAVWLARILDEVGAWDESPQWRDRFEERIVVFLEALTGTRREVIMVSNEVGMGVVPATASGRLYRDELGRLNARVASTCDQLWVCMAGVARQW